MAFCPKCNGVMEAREIVCPHCGYDFPPEPSITQIKRGIEYSALADIALGIGAVAASFVCIGSVLGSLIALVQGQFVNALVYGPISFFLSLAMFVVFIRTLRKD